MFILGEEYCNKKNVVFLGNVLRLLGYLMFGVYVIIYLIFFLC